MMPLDESKSLLNILVIGTGGREHAIIRKLKDEEGIGEIHTVPVKPDIPPSPGILGEGIKIINANPKETPLDIRDAARLVQYIRERDIHLVVIGPEAPLCAGTADILRTEGIAIFGPNKAAARLEGDKSLADRFNKKHDIPAPNSETFGDQGGALQYLEDTHQYPIVIKYPGLAGGKGVTIAKNAEEAKAAIGKCFDGRTYNTEGSVIVQEYLLGTEMSVFFFVDTKFGTIKYFSSAQDHKTRFETGHDGENPMTGGIGAISPSPFEKQPEVMEKVHIIGEKFLAGLLADGIEYQGAVFMGFMITPEGQPKMLEYNVRFGDPEIQPILVRMRSPLGEAMMATVEGFGRLRDIEFDFHGKAMNLVLVDPGYPIKALTPNHIIKGLKNLDPETGVSHSGTYWDVGKEEVLTNSGRVLGLILRGDDETTFAELNIRALQEAAKITFGDEKPGYRTDIGLGKDG